MIIAGYGDVGLPCSPTICVECAPRDRCAEAGVGHVLSPDEELLLT